MSVASSPESAGWTPDSRRYSALGDAVTANVAEWLGLRLGSGGAGNADSETQVTSA